MSWHNGDPSRCVSFGWVGLMVLCGGHDFFGICGAESICALDGVAGACPFVVAFEADGVVLRGRVSHSCPNVGNDGLEVPVAFVYDTGECWGFLEGTPPLF